MSYRPGDLVYPRDLPRRILCQVSETHRLRVSNADEQILKLIPLAGPWPAGTFLIRLDGAVQRATGGRRRSPLTFHPALVRKTRRDDFFGPSSHGDAA